MLGKVARCPGRRGRAVAADPTPREGSMMARFDARCAMLALFATTLSQAGCSGDHSANGPGGGRPGTSPSKFLADLGDPAAVLIVTGQQDGYLEPCGCTRGQAGGLVRRAHLVAQLRAQGCPTALIDLGSLIEDPAARGGVEQSAIKFRYALKALDLLKYDALALSADDLRLGAGRVLGSFVDDLGPATTVVVANVQPAPRYEPVVRPSRVVAAGPVRLGITAVVDPAAVGATADPDRPGLLPSIRRPEDVLPGVLADLQSRSDFQVLMVQGPPELAGRLAAAFPDLDIVISTSETDTPRSRHPDILNDGRTTLVNVGRKGMSVGVFAFDRDPHRRPRYRLVVLDDRYDGPDTAMKTLIRAEYRGALRAARVVEDHPRRPAPGGSPDAAYLGASACRSCHPQAYQKWSTTPHARAFDALLHDQRPDAAFDAECVACHTTGFGFVSGWRSDADTHHLAGNQCENCHGPGSRHASDPDDRAFRRSMALSAEKAGKTLCIRCHDQDNSPGFEFAGYWSRIAHTGLDRYDDPNVHRGSAPRADGGSSGQALP